jgi:hypothetical protein
MFAEIYKNLCDTNKSRKKEYKKYSKLHKHHILPIHLNGNDDEENLTYLTIKEHILAHFLLWKIHENINDLRSMNMLGANLSIIYRKKIGEYCRDNKIGFFGKNEQERETYRKKGRLTQKQNKIGIYNPDTFKKYASNGGKFGSKSQIKQKIAIFNPEKRLEWASLGGKSHKGKIWINKDEKRTRILPLELNLYLENGWKLGVK